MHIHDLTATDESLIQQVAALLVAGFATHWPDAWPTRASALAEVRDSFTSERISRVAMDDDGTVVGWISGASQYNGNVWELHPLVVASSRHGQGIGRALVSDFEDYARKSGGLTVILGSDDETQQTTLADVNLFMNTPTQIASIRNLNRHPYEFYQKLGYVIVGVVPDANGLGRPDIMLAKSLVRDHNV